MNLLHLLFAQHTRRGHMMLAQLVRVRGEADQADTTPHDAPPSPPPTVPAANPWAAQRAWYAQVKPALPLSWRARVFDRSAVLIESPSETTAIAPSSAPATPAPDPGTWHNGPACDTGTCSTLS